MRIHPPQGANWLGASVLADVYLEYCLSVRTGEILLHPPGTVISELEYLA